jgi:hypothetical protein
VQTFRSDRDLERWVWKGSSYRPGDALDDWRQLVHKDGAFHDAREQRFWSDGAVRVNGREYNSLLGNPCFQRGEMSCLSCHSMHPPPSDERPRKEWANDQLKQGMNGSPACLQCHERFEDEATLVAHTHHAPDSHGSNCLNCHMPNTAYGLQKATRNHGIAFPDVTTTLATGRPNACNLCHLDRSLGWTAEQLEAWYGKPQPELSDRDRNVAGAAVWTLSGDAGVRALMAWHLGWAPAQQASGTAWMAPYLAQLLIDPYDAVRSMAHRSLRSLPDFESFAYDSTAALPAQHEGSRRAFRQWNQRRTGAPPADPQAVLMNKRGGLRLALFNELLKQRDDRNVYLAE